MMANLWVGELQACDGEQDLPCCYEDVLGDLPGDVHVVGFHILHPVSLHLTWLLTRKTTKGCHAV